MDFYIGTILPWAGTYAPRGWAFCEGQLLQIQQNTALFAVIGTQYGGDGKSNFALPDLRGRFPIGAGGVNPQTGAAWQPGNKIDSTMNVTLTTANLPAHSHKITSTAQSSGSGTTTVPLSMDIAIPVNNDPSAVNVNTPANNTLTVGETSTSIKANIYTASGPTANDTLKPFNVKKDINIPAPNVNVTVTSACDNTGSGTAINVAPPTLCIRYIIALQGMYPDRDY